ncbi:MAG: pyrroloquinoline quinone biosynthesis protein PqqB [Chromatocurvus sp.]
MLGSGAGGGVPQWNCNCDNCTAVRQGMLDARTQSSLAVSGDGVGWLLINASPDILRQLERFPELQPARMPRDTAIKAVLLVDSQIDHTAGLLMLREHAMPLEIYCTQRVYEDLTSGFPLFTVLKDYCGVNWHEIPVDGSGFAIPGVPGLSFSCHAIAGTAPPYSPHRQMPAYGDNIALVMRNQSSGRAVFYAPGLASIEPMLAPRMQVCDLLLLDGTCWSNDELWQCGVGSRRAREMGHLPQSGPDGMLAALVDFPHQRKLLIHINNTNPILNPSSPECRELRAAGVELAHDGMEFEL